MKLILLGGEFLLGLLILLLTVVTILLSLFVSLTELPKYLRRTSK